MNTVTLSLIAFHLFHRLIDPPNQAAPNATYLWDTLIQLNTGPLNFPELDYLRQKLKCYGTNNPNSYDPQLDQIQHFWLSRQPGLDLGQLNTTPPLRATLNPYRLEDTYAADLTLYTDPQHTPLTPEQLALFHPQTLIAFPQAPDTFLGSLLWLTAQTDQDLDPTAKTCATQILGAHLTPLSPDPQTLCGHPFYEYQTSNSPDPQRTQTLLITLDRTLNFDTFGKAYDWILRFLCYRQKIQFTHHQAEQSYSQARQLYSQIETLIQQTRQYLDPPDLPQLKHQLNQIPSLSQQLAQTLRDLKAHETALITNTENLEKALTQLQTHGPIPTHWQTLPQTCHLWQRQIQLEINYLHPGQDLLTQTLDTIRATLEIRQAEQDRRIEREIQAVGIGLGLAAVSASSSPATLLEISMSQWPVVFQLGPYLLRLHPFLLSLILSLSIGGLGYAGARLIQRLQNRSRSK